MTDGQRKLADEFRRSVQRLDEWLIPQAEAKVAAGEWPQEVVDLLTTTRDLQETYLQVVAGR